MTSFEEQVAATQEWFDSPRFAGIVRLYSARQVVEQRGTIGHDYTVAREAAAAFYDRLRQLFAERKSITTFGPYSPGQAVAMKRMGIEGIYLGGWATSAKGGTSEDPGPDLASYPLSQVPDEAATLVRALLTADRNQHYLRSRMTEAQRAAAPAHDFRPFIIADADTGHGGDAARAQPDPPLRRGRRSRLPHRGPAPGRQEVRPSGRQGARGAGRAEQATERRALPARRHGRSGHHRRPHRRRSRQPDRQPRRRARPALPTRRHQRRRAGLQGMLPGADPAFPRARSRRTQRPSAVRHPGRRARRRPGVAGAPRHSGAGRRSRGGRCGKAKETSIDAMFDRSRRQFSRARGRTRPY